MQKKGVFPDDLGLRKPVFQKTFHFGRKVLTTFIVALVCILIILLILLILLIHLILCTSSLHTLYSTTIVGYILSGCWCTKHSPETADREWARGEAGVGQG